MKNFETERLVFALYDEKIYDDFIRLFTDEAVMKHVDKGVMSEPAADALWHKLIDEFYPKGIDTIWAVLAKEDRRFVAHASIRPRPENNSEVEIGYILPRIEWGKGYATEIARKLVEVGFEELGLKAVYATVDTDNHNSIRVLEKCGMEKVRSEYDEQGEFYVYGIKR